MNRHCSEQNGDLQITKITKLQYSHFIKVSIHIYKYKIEVRL